MTFNGIFYFIVFDLAVCGVIGSRFRRHQGNHQYHQDSVEQAQIEQESRATCKSVCDTEYKRDFEATFHISYSNRFYEFPLDPLISQSRRKMTQYCQVASRKFDCYQEDCGFENVPWSTDRHICIDHMEDFHHALNCLNVTSPGAHRECNEACTDGWSNVLDSKAENRYLNRSGMGSDERARYKNLNRQCHFQMCQLECRKRLIESFCPIDERQHALRVIEGYYAADYIDQLSKMQKYNIVHLFPRLCSNLLPESMKSEVENANQHSIEKTMKKFRKLAQKAVATML